MKPRDEGGHVPVERERSAATIREATADARFSPRDFLRARRPERFSDSVVDEQPVLDRSILEYHLETLTNRSQEADFARFVHKLASREVCPNLLPQTGPTGGGDSKVDAETYPVADGLSLVWYIGNARDAASERWAFAFSAKQDWRSKVQSDVAKLVATGRGYAKAFFVTNQYVRDKQRAEVEDELRTKHGLDVHIFDRTWILERIFDGKHEALAIEELRLSTSVRRAVRRGPLDTEREADLTAVEERIRMAIREGVTAAAFVSDCIQAAELARSLEKPRTEVEGRFARAEDVAQKYGTPDQLLEVAYERAWTAFWWFEDFQLFTQLYAAVEERAQASRNACHLELLTNVWQLLHMLVRTRRLFPEQAVIELRTSTLGTALQRLSEEQGRPSTALQARTLLLLMRLVEAAPHPPDDVFEALAEVVRESEGLVGYPLEPLVQILTELGDYLEGRPAYDALFEVIVEVSSRRKGEVVAARMLLRRGGQHLKADQPYDAIRLVGRALRGLYKHESRDEIVRALYLCGIAYERAGLLWAARGSMLHAASVATNEFWTYSTVVSAQAACYRRMKWLELQLGRFPHALAWHESNAFVAGALVSQGYARAPLTRGELEFDFILGRQLLSADLWQLKQLTHMPDVLDRLALHSSSIALLYALGYEDDVPEGFLGKEETLQDVVRQWRDKLAIDESPAPLSLCDQRTVTLNSTILGCRISAQVDNASPYVELGESILAAMEALLSTSIVQSVVPTEPTLTLRVRRSDFVESPFAFELRDQDGRPHVDVRCAAFNPHKVAVDLQQGLKTKILDLLAVILGRVFLIGDPEHVLTTLFRDELAVSRALDFTGTFSALGNVLGHTPKLTLTEWQEVTDLLYTLKRHEEWDAADRRFPPDSTIRKRSLVAGAGEPPEAAKFGGARHSQIEVVSLIRGALWDGAGWSGTAFLTSPDGAQPPILAPMFTNRRAAIQIFDQLRKELGTRDVDNRLRIILIRGIDRDNPYAYRVVLGSNPVDADAAASSKYLITIWRVNTMNASSDLNLERFLENYRACGMYFMAPAFSADGVSDPDVMSEKFIAKRELVVRRAWEIGRNDVDTMGIKEDDRPIIPAGKEEDAPILDVLRWMAERTSHE